METKIIKIDTEAGYSEALKMATLLLKAGEVVAVPTETVYGLAACSFSKSGVEAIYSVKKRPSDNPLIFHIGSVQQLEQIVHLSQLPIYFNELAEAFWPGPLTLVLPKKEGLPSYSTGSLPSVAVRLPDAKIVRDLCTAVDSPLVAPSANTSGRPSPTNAKHVYDDLHDLIPLIIDGGDTFYGLESTVLDLTSSEPTLLRPGAISVEQIECCIGRSVIVPGHITNPEVFDSDDVKSPGMKYKHYSPNAEVILVIGDNLNDLGNLNLDASDIVVSTTDLVATNFIKFENIENMAASIFNLFREKESIANRFIVCLPASSKSEIYLGLLNRMTKAANRIIRM